MLFAEIKQLCKTQTGSARVLPFGLVSHRRGCVFLRGGDREQEEGSQPVAAAESQGSTGQTTHAGSELNRLLLTRERKSISGAVSVVTEGLAMEKVEEIKLRVFY